MVKQIRAKVARILNSREVVITAGADQGVKIGMYFDILEIKSEPILDPDTGEVLDYLDRAKVRVKVKEVKNRISVASTFRKKTVNIGGPPTPTQLLSELTSHRLTGLSRELMPPKYVTKYETLKIDESQVERLEETNSYIKTGDDVVQVDELAETVSEQS